MTVESAGLRQATDYEVLKINLTTNDGRVYNIRNLVPSMQIYEDIELPFITVSLNIRDALGFVNTKIVGGEIVEISFRTKGMTAKNTFTKIFEVYEIARREHSKSKELLWQLSLVSVEQDTNIRTKISRSFKDKKAAAIIGEILKSDLESSKDYISTDDQYNQKYVIPYKHPFEVIKFFKERAISDSGKASYMFFENSRGYTFKPIEELAQAVPIQLTYRPDGINPNFPNYNVVEDYYPTQSAGDNIHENIKYGMEGSYGTYFDMVDKKVVTQGTNKASQFYMVFSSDQDNRPRTWLESRTRVIGEFYNIVYNFALSGSTNRTVGDTVYFNLPSAKSTGSDATFDRDEKLDGLYIIKRIKHDIEGTIYKQVIEVSRIDESLTDPVINSDGTGGRNQVITDEREAYVPEDSSNRDCEPMRTSERGKLELLSHEGIVTSRYLDIKGVWTIGAGVTSAAGASVNPDTYRGRVTPDDAVDMFNRVLIQYEDGVNAALECYPATQAEFDALVSLAYNVGAGLGTDTRALIKEGRIASAIDLWRADRALHDRRDAEIALATTGVYKGNRIPVYNATPQGEIIYDNITYYNPSSSIV